MGKVVTKKEEMTYLDDLGLLADCWYCRTPRARPAVRHVRNLREVKRARPIGPGRQTSGKRRIGGLR